MGLINLTTNLKSLKYGKDRLGGGDSGQPYVKQPLITDPGSLSQLDNDFLLRGGIRAPINAAEDVFRLTRYMFDFKSPSGFLFGIKQNLLSRVAVPNEAAQTWGINNPGPAYAGGGLNEGIYTPLSTLAQAGVNYVGFHFNKQGLDPTGFISALSLKKYEDVVKEKNQRDFNILNIDVPIGAIQAGNNLANNPLIPGLNPFAQTGNLTPVDFNALSNIATFQNRLLDLWYGKAFVLNSTLNVLEYGGGPGSILGVGKTKIPFGENQRTGINNPLFVSNPQFYTKGGKTSPSNYIVKELNPDDTIKGYKYTDTLNYLNLLGVSNSANLSLYYIGINGNGQFTTRYNPQTPYSTLSKSDPEGFAFDSKTIFKSTEILPDFREGLDPEGTPQNTYLSVSPNYTRYNIENWRNLGSPGQQGNISNYKTGKILPGSTTSTVLDKINASFIYKVQGANGAEAKSTYPNLLTKEDGLLRDIVPFYIAILNNDRQERYPNRDTYKKYMHFRAFIDNFSDSYDADWSAVEYMGRAEKLYKYKGFGRKISLAFTVVAQSRGEMTAMYDKLNFLASSLAPEYLDSFSSGYMAGNIAYITLGDYISEQPGIINSLTYEVPEDSSWETGLNPDGKDTEPKDIRRLPFMIKVNLDFTVIHKFRPSKQVFKNDSLGTDSVRLLEPGIQKYIDPLRPTVTNYDEEAKRNAKAATSTSTDKAPVQSQPFQNMLFIPSFQYVFETPTAELDPNASNLANIPGGVSSNLLNF
jgi:hypothetical protein